MTRFEIVRSDAAQPFHGRIRAGNGRITFSGEQLARRRSAVNTIVHHVVDLVHPDHYELLDDGVLLVVNGQDRLIEITDVDER